MPKVTWIKITSKKYGGVIYGEKAREALSESCEVDLKEISSGRLGLKYLKLLEWFLGLNGLSGYSDLWIRDNFFSIALSIFDRTKGKKMAAVYHIDSSVFNPILRLANAVIEKLFYWQLKKNDSIMTISDYWRNHFLDRGYKNIYKIPPAFNLSDFDIRDEEEFKKRYGLEKKPIVYIGNCQKAKGVVQSCEALKGLDVHLVTSGRQDVKIPALNINSSYSDYLKLLKSSSVVITMSLFNEGWCMTAHESLLLKTPVIGSGKGGMEELLKGGNQIICKDFKELREKVEYLLNHPEERKRLGNLGYEFAKEFTFERFKEKWLEVVKKEIGS